MSQCYSGNCSEGGLEYIANSNVNYSVAAPSEASYNVSFTPRSQVHYSITNQETKVYSQNKNHYIPVTPQAEYQFQPQQFLKPGKEGKFVGKASEIQEFVEQTFQLMFNKPFPSDIKVSVLNDKEFGKLTKSPGTIGLSINRSEQGLLSEIFVKNDFLGKVMLTLGHELGHVLTPTLSSTQDEEAKAYAFSLAWIKTIKEHNIADLKDALVTEIPANNGVHDKAFFFVEQLLRQGKDVWDLYLKLIRKEIKVSDVAQSPHLAI